MCAGNQKLLASHSVVALFMNGTLFAGFPKVSSTGPNGSARSSVNVLLSMGAILAVCGKRS